MYNRLTFNIVCNTVVLCVCVTQDVLLLLCCDDDTITANGRRTGLRKLTSDRVSLSSSHGGKYQPAFLIHCHLGEVYPSERRSQYYLAFMWKALVDSVMCFRELKRRSGARMRFISFSGTFCHLGYKISETLSQPEKLTQHNHTLCSRVMWESSWCWHRGNFCRWGLDYLYSKQLHKRLFIITGFMGIY